MTSRRLSRGTPVLAASRDEQEAMVKAIEDDPAMIEAIEELTGKKLTAMKFGEKVTAYGQLITQGMALAPVVAAVRTKNELAALADEHRGNVSVSDANRLLVEENAALREETRQQKRLIDDLNRKVERLIAGPGMAQAGDAA